MKKYTLLLAFALLSACAGTGPQTSAPKTLSFSQSPPLMLNVSQIVVVNEFKALKTGSGAEDAFHITPADAVQQWVKDRLKAGGQEGAVRVIIKDASVTETQLPRTEGLKGFFTQDQALRYDGRLAVEVIADVPEKRMSGMAEANAHRSITLPEKATLNQKENIQYALVKDLMSDMDIQLEQSIRTYLAPFLK